MKAYGLKRVRGGEGCLCALCRSRGYRKGRAYGQMRKADCTNKGRARREGKQQAGDIE